MNHYDAVRFCFVNFQILKQVNAVLQETLIIQRSTVNDTISWASVSMCWRNAQGNSKFCKRMNLVVMAK